MRAFASNRLAYLEDMINDPEVQDAVYFNGWMVACDFNGWTDEFKEIKAIDPETDRGVRFERPVTAQSFGLEVSIFGTFYGSNNDKIFYFPSKDLALRFQKPDYEKYKSKIDDIKLAVVKNADLFTPAASSERFDKDNRGYLSFKQLGLNL